MGIICSIPSLQFFCESKIILKVFIKKKILSYPHGTEITVEEISMLWDLEDSVTKPSGRKVDEKARSARLGWRGRLGKALQREKTFEEEGTRWTDVLYQMREGSGSMKKKRAQRSGHTQQDGRAGDLWQGVARPNWWREETRKGQTGSTRNAGAADLGLKQNHPTDKPTASGEQIPPITHSL